MSTQGTIFQVSISRGGVPKRAVPSAEVTVLGIAGDGHNEPEPIHGGPERALCIYSREVIDALIREGHPIFPGATGENVTIEGVDWSRVLPGARLQLGPGVVAEVTRYATPCRTNARWFKNEDFNRIHHALYPGWSRVYARVLGEGGVIRPGDPVTLTDAPPGTVPAVTYRRKISSEEVREGYVLIEASKTGVFPRVGESFTLVDGAEAREAQLETYPCQCRGPSKPHRHYFIRVGGLEKGKSVTFSREGPRQYRLGR
jgi:MOSC domain-containing protein YiiM